MTRPHSDARLLRAAPIERGPDLPAWLVKRQAITEQLRAAERARIHDALDRLGRDGLDRLRRASLNEGESFARELAAIEWRPKS